MPSRTALAAGVTLAATLISGAVAMAATTRGATTHTASAAGAAVAAAAPTPTRSAAPVATPAAPVDPLATLLLAVGQGNQASGTPVANSAAAAAWFAGLAARAQPSGATVSAPANSKPGSDTTKRTPAPTSSPPTSPPTTAAPSPTTPTTSPPYNCSGSDDGMSETYKHAREQYCESRHG